MHEHWAAWTQEISQRKAETYSKNTQKSCQQRWDENCFSRIEAFISIPLNEPLLSWHNGADFKRIWAGGWTRTTANSKQALFDEECTGLQISAQWRIWRALITVLRPGCCSARTPLEMSMNWSLASVRKSGLCSDFMLCWIKEAVISPCRPRLMFTLHGFSWHCVLGKWASTCFSNSPLGVESCALNYDQSYCGNLRHLWNRLTDT